MAENVMALIMKQNIIDNPEEVGAQLAQINTGKRKLDMLYAYQLGMIAAKKQERKRKKDKVATM